MTGRRMIHAARYLVGAAGVLAALILLPAPWNVICGVAVVTIGLGWAFMRALDAPPSYQPPNSNVGEDRSALAGREVPTHHGPAGPGGGSPIGGGSF